MLLDTSGLFCLLVQRDPRHIPARKLYSSALTRLTHGGVIVELVALAQARGLPHTQTLVFITNLLANSDIEVLWPDETSHRAALALLQNRLDKTYSLCDAVSFLIMRERGVLEALTTDGHFEQEGFVRLLPQ